MIKYPKTETVFNRDNNIKYIVKLKPDKKLEYTTINKFFCGELLIRDAQMIFKLNGSNDAIVIIPMDWIEYMAPSKVHWGLDKDGLPNIKVGDRFIL